MGSENALARFPIAGNHAIEKVTLNFKELEHALIEKAGQLFLRTCSLAPCLRGFRNTRLRRLDRAIDEGLEFHEILAEHFDKFFRGLVEGLLVGPGFNRIEQMRLNALDQVRHRNPKIGILAKARPGKRTVESGG
jgi:hypothetical protein